MAMTDGVLDRIAIRETIENWVLWRDAGRWEEFRTVWHGGGYMVATWNEGTADEFIEASRKGWEKGVHILHFLGGTTIELAGDRAVAQTKMVISQRDKVHGVECDVNCMGRFYDLLDKRDGRWGVVRRQPIYEKDRIDPVDPAARLELDQDRLGRFPDAYRHLGYLQSLIGYDVYTDRPTLRGPTEQRVYAMGANWLAGKEAQF